MPVIEFLKGSLRASRAKNNNLLIRCSKRINIYPNEYFDYDTRMVFKCNIHESYFIEVTDKFKNCIDIEEIEIDDEPNMILRIKNISNQTIRLLIKDNIAEINVINNRPLPESKSEEPKSEEPKSEESKSEESKSEEPKSEESKSEEPKSEESKSEESKSEESKSEESKSEEPKSEE